MNMKRYKLWANRNKSLIMWVMLFLIIGLSLLIIMMWKTAATYKQEVDYLEGVIIIIICNNNLFF